LKYGDAHSFVEELRRTNFGIGASLSEENAKLIQLQHDRIAQTKGSFKRTLSNLCDLEANIHRYRIKFIVNDMMISTNFSFNDFLAEYKLNPEEIVIARLNKTIKSQKKSSNITVRS